MKWSWRIGTFAGIGVYVHATFLLIIGWFAFASWQDTQTIIGTLTGVFFVIALFLCVVLHEYGHALTARRYGIATRDITLLPIGGVARLERMPDDPMQELWVAVAGPAVNLAIALVLFGWISISTPIAGSEELDVMSSSMAWRLMSINIVLAVFNMIPAFPMDGGRVVRAVLAMQMPYTRATQLAASLGQSLAFMFFLIGLWTQPWLMLIGAFIWIGASQESSMVQLKSALYGIPVHRAMVTTFRTADPNETLQEIVSAILNGTQADFPVVDENRVVGVLIQADLLEALSEGDVTRRVADVMRREFEIAHPNDMLQTLFMQMQDSTCDCRMVPVLGGDDRLVGLVTKENTGEFLQIQAAMAESRKGMSSGTA